MHNAKAKVLLLFWMVILTSGVAGAWYMFGAERKANREYVDSRTDSINGQFNDVMGRMNKVESGLEEISGRFASQIDAFNAVQEKIVLSEKEKKELFDALAAIKADISKFEQNYSQELSGIKNEVGVLSQQINNCAKNVNLGEISVTKNAPVAEQADAAKK